MNESDRVRVLLVDDDYSMLTSMEAVLCEAFDVRTCGSPTLALRILERESYSVVCADWQMPEMDGMEFFRTLSRRELEQAPCCILITAHTSELIDQVSSEDRKMLGMLRKPFRPEELIERVALFANLAQLKRSNSQLKAAMRGGHS